jgi:hypothetical protein
MKTGYDVYMRCVRNMQAGAEQAWATRSYDVAIGRERQREYYLAAAIGFASH